ncbi:MAG: hypothetical protein U0168_13460 [Nannocystaceae bacterium]
MTLQRIHYPMFEHVRGAAVALATASVMLGCPVADDGETVGESGTATESASDASASSTQGTADSGSGDTSGSAGTTTDDPTDTDTTDTATTGEHRVVECMNPGTMTWMGDVYIYDEAGKTLLDGYSSVTGDIKISMEVIDNLDFLPCLTSVGGNIQIFGTTITDIAGLGGLETIGGSLSISENANLQEVYGLGALTDLGGALIITKNPNLVAVSEIDALQQIHLGVNIDENDKLVSITALQNTVAIGSDCANGNCPDLSISYNPELTNIDGLIGLPALGGQLLVTGNPKLCLSKVMSLADMLQQWVEEGQGDTTGNKDC